MELLACWHDDHSLLWCWSVGGGSDIGALIFDPFFLFLGAVGDRQPWWKPD